uniref:Uncharacterized protein n=1 Tax=Panagrolaimus davidi TaxID=227884 RepID=A0A914PG00_9BILA
MGNDRQIVEACHSAGLLPALIELSDDEIQRTGKTQNYQILKEITRAMFYLVNEAPQSFYNQDTTELFEVLHELLKSKNFEVVSNAAWTFMAHRNPAKVNSEILPLLISYFDRGDPYISFPVLATLGTITNTEKAVELINANVLKHIKNMYKADYEQLNNGIMSFFTRFILGGNDREYRRQAVYNIGVVDMALENLDDPQRITQETSLFLLSHLLSTDDSEVFDYHIRTPQFLEKLTNCIDNEIDDKYTNQVMSIILLLIHRSADHQNYAIKTFYENGMIQKLQKLKNNSDDKEIKFLAHVLSELIKDGVTKDDNVVLVIPKFVFRELAEIRQIKQMSENEKKINQDEEL